jgi:hypothetical protein
MPGRCEEEETGRRADDGMKPDLAFQRLLEADLMSAAGE